MIRLSAALIYMVIAASLACWIIVALRRASGRTVLAWQPRPDCPWGLADLVLAVLLLGAGQVCASLLVRERFGLDPKLALQQWDLESRAALVGPTAVATLVAIGFCVTWLALRHGARLRELGLDTRCLPSDLGLGMVAFVMLTPLVYAIQWLLVQWFESEHPLLELVKERPDAGFFAMVFFSAVVVAPVVEEYLFRVLLQSWLERLAEPHIYPLRILLGGRTPPARDSFSTSAGATGAPRGDVPPDVAEAAVADGGLEESGTPRPFWPVVVSALLFALAHWSHGPDPIPLLLLALALGFLYQRTGRIVPCIVAHALLNGTSLAVRWLAMNYDLG